MPRQGSNGTRDDGVTASIFGDPDAELPDDHRLIVSRPEPASTPEAANIVAVEEVQDNDGATDDGVGRRPTTRSRRGTFVDAGSPAVKPVHHTATQVTKKKGEPTLTLSPGRIDPTNAVWNSSASRW